MHICRSLLTALSAFAALTTSLTAHAQVSPYDAMRTCKNEAGERMPSVPLAQIVVERGSDTGNGSFMINFRTQRSQGRPASGFCIISREGQLQNLQFDPPSGTRPGAGGIGGNFGGRVSPQVALQACKNIASERMPALPRAAISVDRGTDPGDGGYMVNFRTQPRFGTATSGFCNITWNGHVQRFEFDAPPPQQQPSPPPYGGRPGAATENFGGQTPYDAMRSCKSTVSRRFPNVPLAFIDVDMPRVNGGSLLSDFRVRAPIGLHANGSCDVFRNGRVNLTIR